jgi:hypothetical protein
MKKVGFTIKGLAVLGIVFCFIGAPTVSATRAVTDKGTGCYVRVGTGEDDYIFDETCSAHQVIKFDNDGNFDFYTYQDHGQLPDWAWHPSQSYQLTFEVCYDFEFGLVCGVADESVSPSGEYKSSFRSH